MCTIVSFEPRHAAINREPLPAGETASVVIFPGIRYERAKFIAPAGQPAAANGLDRRMEKPLPR